MDKPTLNASNFLSLAETFPGFQENPTSGQNNPTASSGSSINFNNTGTRGATFQINGVNNDDSSENQNRQGVGALDDPGVPDPQERLFGGVRSRRRCGGAGADQVGHQQLRGDAYVYRQDSDWNARTWFAAPGSAKPRSRRRRTQYGVDRRLPDHAEQAVRLRQRRLRTELDGENTYTRDSFCRRRSTARG